MRNVRIPPKAQWSIFGDTYGGVPSPNTVLVHGYPTRYHGPNFTVPQPGYQYRLRTYAKAPFLGIDGLGQLGGIAARFVRAIRGRRSAAPVKLPASAGGRQRRHPRPAPPGSIVCPNPHPIGLAVWDVDEVWSDWSAVVNLCGDDLPYDEGGREMKRRWELATLRIKAAIAWAYGGKTMLWCSDRYHENAHWVSMDELLMMKKILLREGDGDCSPWPTREKLATLQRVARQRVLPIMASFRRPVSVAGCGC